MLRLAAFALVTLIALTPLRAHAETEKGGEWLVNCQGEGNAAKCMAVHDILVKTGDKPDSPMGRVLRLTILKADQGQMVMLALLPQGVFIPTGVATKIDDQAQAPMALQRCAQLGCEAVMVLSPDTVQVLRKGKELKVAFKMDPNAEPAVVLVMLKGIGAALDKLK